ncbi:hypothetical protein [uncultured Anaerovibrio sp.]|uniref:hypothetical protein n=1 Tax=uncultured Anaerovibrio sp. TaxID=361586 RepID=UPI00262A0F0B|nr:hypothetical protein [uncultured Anaerovibrio sp.]
MFDFDLKAFVWLCIGAGGVLVAIMVMALCKVSGRQSRIEEAMEDYDRMMKQKWSRYK